LFDFRIIGPYVVSLEWQAPLFILNEMMRNSPVFLEKNMARFFLGNVWFPCLNFSLCHIDIWMLVRTIKYSLITKNNNID
jgi:hypothetical protein